MKKILFVLLSIISIFSFIGVNAAESNLVNVYVFYGEDCLHCKALHKYLDELKKDKKYKNKFNVIYFEVTNDSDNEYLFKRVREELGISTKGVPLYFIGDDRFIGFNPDTDKKEIKDSINTKYKSGYSDTIANLIYKYSQEPETTTRKALNDDINASEKKEGTSPIFSYVVLVLGGLIISSFIILNSKKDEK